MNTHYFTDNNELESNKKLIKCYINEKDLKFYTDNGVFSKKGLDYGTRLMLENIDFKPSHKEVLDLGCGYGPVGIYVASILESSNVTMVDVNPRAIELSTENINLNVTFNANAKLIDGTKTIDGKFDLVITNPPFRAGKKTCLSFVDSAFESLNKDGDFYFVVQKKQGAPSYKKYIEDKFGNVNIVAKDKGYFVLTAKK